MAKSKEGLNVETIGWEEAKSQLLLIAKNLDKKYALSYTAAIAKALNNSMKAKIARGDRASRRYTKWPMPAFKAIKTQKLKKKAKIKHGDIGHRVGLFGKMWAARGAWLERGHVTANGGRTRAYEWVKPARQEVEPLMPMLGKLGIENKLKRDAKRAEAKIKSSKKP